jgi:hypothetical protein
MECIPKCRFLLSNYIVRKYFYRFKDLIAGNQEFVENVNVLQRAFFILFFILFFIYLQDRRHSESMPRQSGRLW